MANEFKIRKGLIVEGASGGTVVDVQGSQGQLFSVTDNLSGSIFAVSDISGVPIFDVNSNGGSVFTGLVSGITPVNANNFVTKAYADSLTPGVGVFLPLTAGSTEPLSDSLFVKGNDKGVVIQNAASTINVTAGAVSSSALNTGLITLRHNGVTKIVLNANDNSYFNNGNVGIGTTSPNNTLELYKTVSSAIGPILQLTNSQYTNANDSGSSIQFRGYTLWGPGSSNPRYSEINAINGSGSVPKRIEFKFYADTDEKTPLSILQTGRVGVGTTTPGNVFVVESAASASAVEFINTNADANPSGLVLKKLSASPADNDVLGRIIFQGNNDATTPGLRTFARIETVATDVTDGEEDGDLYFYTTNEGSQSAKLRILDVGAIQSRTSGLIQLNYRNGSSYSYIAPTVYNNWNRIGTFTSPDNGARIFTEILAKGDNNYPYWMKGTVVVSFYSTGVSVSCQTDGGYAGGHNFQCIVTKDGTTYDVWLRVPTIEWSSFVSYRTLYNSGFTENYIFTIASGNVSNSAPTGVDDETNSIEPNSSFRFTNTDLKTPTHQYRTQNFLIDGSTTVEFQHNQNIFTQKIGIGTTSPDYDLDVERTATTINDDPTIRIRNAWNAQGNNTGFSNRADLLNLAGAGAVAVRTRARYDTDANWGEIGTTTSHDFNIRTSNSNRITVKSGGNVGIGLIDPDSRLDINAGVTAITAGPAVRISKGASPVGLIRYDTLVIEANDVPTIRLGESDGTVSSIMSGDSNLRINSTHPIKFYTNGTATGEAHAGQGGTFAMIIDNSQNVGINTTNPGKKLEVAGSYKLGTNAYIEYGGVYPYTITTANTASVGNLVFSAGLGSAAYESRIDLQGTNTAGIAGITLSTASTARMVVTADGDVGIGTSTPNAKLDVQGTQGQLFSVTDDLSGDIFSVADISGVPIMNINSSGVSTFDGNVNLINGALSITGDGSNAVTFTESSNGLLTVNAPDDIILDSGSDIVLDTAGNDVRFKSSGTEYGRITKLGDDLELSSSVANGDILLIPNGTGNVGIGTTNPNYKLDVSGNIRSLSTINVDRGSIAGTAANLTECRSINAFSYNTLRNGSTTGFFIAPVDLNVPGIQVVDSSNNAQNLAIQPYGGDVGIGNKAPSYLLDVRKGNVSGAIARFSAVNAHVIIESSTAGPAVLHLKPNTTGSKSGQFKVTAGNGYNFRWSNDAYGTSEVSYMKLDTSTTGGGDLTVKGDIIAYGAPSDRKYKENIKPIESALDKAMQLQGVTFDWKDSESILDIKEDIGFIAQDVEKVLPELVRDNGKGNLSLRYQGITPILLEAIKELKEEIDLLKSKPCNCNNCNCNI